MCTVLEVETISECCNQVLNLNDAQLSDEYYYQSLPLCVIDAVYSIAVNYKSTQNTVQRYCNYFNITKVREDRNIIPPIEAQQSVDDLLQKFDELGIEHFTTVIFDNRQRTSTKNGICKSEAVWKFCEVLGRFHVNYLQDINTIIENNNFENEITLIPGQGSGISLKYFFMLAGSENLIKPDRMILGFLKNVLQRHVTMQEAEKCLRQVNNRLTDMYPHLTPRLLDHMIWQYQRAL